MKKLLVTDVDMIDSDIVNKVQEYLSLQMSYGLYDFDTERLVEDVCRHFDLKRIGDSHPEIYLGDEAGGTLTLTFKDEHLGY